MVVLVRQLLGFIPLLLLLPVIGCSEERLPDVVLITLDTTRVDHLSCYGYVRATSPRLDRLATEAVRYTRAWSTSSWTLPAHASLFTGLYPAQHGAHYDPKGNRGFISLRVGSLRKEITTLPERLSEEGYQTGAFIGGPWLKEIFGVMQGFAKVDDHVEGFDGVKAKGLTDRALAWLETLHRDRPFFLFVNYFDAHAPYEPPDEVSPFGRAREEVDHEWWEASIRDRLAPSEATRQILIDRYDTEILGVDQQLGRLLDSVDEFRADSVPLIIVTADHGEAFGEDDRWLHNLWLSEELTRIPLLVRHPDREGAGTSRDEMIQLVDVAEMVCDVVGLNDRCPGERTGREDRTMVFTELYRNPADVKRFGARFDRSLHAVVADSHKLLSRDPGEPTFYAIDGLLERPLSGNVETTIRQSLADALQQRLKSTEELTLDTPEIDARTRESLQALGYVE
jgi:arylsulfatase A-like enzyme